MQAIGRDAIRLSDKKHQSHSRGGINEADVLFLKLTVLGAGRSDGAILTSIDDCQGLNAAI